jgi:hypothetical protein
MLGAFESQDKAMRLLACWDGWQEEMEQAKKREPSSQKKDRREMRKEKTEKRANMGLLSFGRLQ